MYINHPFICSKLFILAICWEQDRNTPWMLCQSISHSAHQMRSKSASCSLVERHIPNVKKMYLWGYHHSNNNHKVANQEEVDLRVKDLQDRPGHFYMVPRNTLLRLLRLRIGVGFEATFVCASFSCLHKAWDSSVMKLCTDWLLEMPCFCFPNPREMVLMEIDRGG